MSRTWVRGVWRLADPRLTLASLSSMGLGAAAAARAGPLDGGWLAMCVGGIVALEIAKNASGEIADFDSGTDLAVEPEDRSPFSGGRRVLVDRLLTRGETRRISLATYGLGIVLGLAIACFREWRVIPLGVAGAGLAWCYGAPPIRLAYRGVGELAVAAVYGPLICGGTYLVQRHAFPWSIVWLSLPLGLLIAGFLWINEFPDYRADLGTGKLNLVVRLGRARAARAFAVILAAAFALQAFLPLLAEPRGVWLGLAALPLAVAAARRTIAAPENVARLVPAQAWTLQCFTLLAAATAAGLLWSRA